MLRCDASHVGTWGTDLQLFRADARPDIELSLEPVRCSCDLSIRALVTFNPISETAL